MKPILDFLPFLLFLVVVLASIAGGDIIRLIGGVAMSFSPFIVIAIAVVIFVAVSVKAYILYRKKGRN